VAVGENVVGDVPVVIPVVLSHSIHKKYCELAGTSENDGFAGGVNVGWPASLYKKAAICWRVTLAAGENVVGDVPVVIPVVLSHSIHKKYCELAGTSENDGFAGGLYAGWPAALYKKAAICWRVTLAVGENVVADVPVVTPVDANQHM